MKLVEQERLNELGFVLGASAGAKNVQARLSAFQALEPILAAEAFADVGCGRGAFSVALASSCRRISLVDIQPANLEAAQRALTGLSSIAVDVHCNPAESLPLASNCYDAVFMVEVLDHVRDVTACLAEAFRILKSRGRCYLTVPNRLFPWETHPVKCAGVLLSPYLFPFLPWCPPLHRRMATARVFSSASIKLAARRAGFRSVKLGYVMPPLERTGLTFLTRIPELLGRSPFRAFGVSIAAVLSK